MTHFSKTLALWLGAATLGLNSAASAATDAKTNGAPAAANATNAAPAKPAAKLDDLFPDPVVVKAKGFEIKRSQLDDALIAIKGKYAAQGQPLSARDTLVLESRVLDNLIAFQLLLARATDADKTKSKEWSENALAEMRKMAPSEDAFNRQLKLEGMTLESLRTRLMEDAIRETVLARELKVGVSDADAEKYYQDHPARFEQPEMVRASHILLTTRDSTSGADLPDEQKKAKQKQIEDILKRARNGEDFGKLAKEFSDDARTKANGGELNPFPRGTMQRTPEFEAAAFSLKTNQISDVITTTFGYHIIKLNERIPARKAKMDDEAVFSPGGYVMIKNYWPAPLEKTQKVSDLIRQILQTEQARQRVPAYLEKLKQEAGVEILDEKLKPKEAPKAAAAEPAK